MLMLLCLRHYKPSLWRINVNDFSLGGLQGREQRNLTVGVVGTGSIGKQVIRTLQGFGCRILAYSRHPAPNVDAEYVDLDTLYAQSDLITYHTALTPETFHMVNAESIAKMKNGVIIVNSARGPLMDSAALVEAVERGKIGALGLDCIEKEEGIYHKNHRDDIISNRDMAYLRQFPNVVMTPHMAFIPTPPWRAWFSAAWKASWRWPKSAPTAICWSETDKQTPRFPWTGKRGVFYMKIFVYRKRSVRARR